MTHPRRQEFIDRGYELSKATAPGDRSFGAMLDSSGVLDALTEAESEIAQWHAKCDEVGIPHIPDALVTHHRGNAGLAAAFGFMADVERLRNALEDIWQLTNLPFSDTDRHRIQVIALATLKKEQS